MLDACNTTGNRGFAVRSPFAARPGEKRTATKSN
jgi:hypothetical protein